MDIRPTITSRGKNTELRNENLILFSEFFFLAEESFAGSTGGSAIHNGNC